MVINRLSSIGNFGDLFRKMRVVSAMIGTWGAAGVTYGQGLYQAPYEFRTLAGGAGIADYVEGSPSLARFSSPNSIAVDGAGNIFVADTYNHVIRKIDSHGMVSLFAGRPLNPGSDDGSGDVARFYQPAGIALDSSGNVYVADTNNHTIRKISPSGYVSTIAGAPGVNGSTNGTAADSRFGYPTGLAVDGSGNIFVADFANQAIRKISAAGIVSTLAGNVPVQGYMDGQGTTAEFKYPYNVAVGPSGNVYVADAGNHVVRVIDPSGMVATYAGSALNIGSGDGVAGAARFRAPSGVAVDAEENLYVMDFEDQLVRRITPGRLVTTIAGLSLTPGSTDGIGDAARFTSAYGIAVDASGTLYVADTGNHTIRAALPPTAPAFQTGPVARSLTYGQNLTLSVVASGSPAPSFQWQKDGVNISGATSSSFVIPAVALTDAGSFRVVATNYLGSTPSAAVNVLVGKAPAVVNLGNLNATYDGGAHVVTATTTPSSLGVTYTYNNGASPPVGAGSYSVVATVVDGNYEGSATGTLVVAKANAAVGLSGLNAIYDGSARAVTVTTTPTALPVAITYNGSGSAPSGAGSYLVVATVNHPDYVGSANGTLVIGKAAAGVTLNGLSVTYNGLAHPAGVVTVPAGLNVITTYNGSTTPPVTSGTYVVSATLQDNNYAATVSSSLVIAKASPVVSWTAPLPVSYGTALTPIQLNASASVGGSFSYSPSAGSMLDTGTHVLNATFTPADQENYLVGSGSTALVVNRAAQTIRFDQVPDRRFGDAPFALQAQANPSGLPVSFTIVSGPGSIVGNALTIFGPGLITVRASQAGNLNFLPSPAVEMTFLAAPMGLAGDPAHGDFNGDRKPDLVWSNHVSGERALWLMNGTTFLGSSTLGTFPLEWTVAATADFNADGWPDIVWSNSATGERAIWLMQGTTFLGASTLGFFPLEWTVAATGDFNHDGAPDLVWSNGVTGERALWLMNGTSFLGASTLGNFPLEWTIAAVGDFNEDQNDDLIWSNSITGERAIWLMDGTNYLGSSSLGVFPLEWTVCGAADFNGDHKTDLIWSNGETGERALWLMNGTAFLGVSTLGVFPLEWTVTN